MSVGRTINAERLLRRLRDLGQIGRTPDGALARVALTNADKAGRDAVVLWMKAVGMAVEIDAIGNIFGTWGAGAGSNDDAPIMIGSHIDTVANAGIYDGNYVAR